MASRPNRIVQLTDKLEIGLVGIEVDQTDALEGKLDEGRRFLTRTPISLGFNWNAVEVYEPYEARQWNVQLAAQWAEQEIVLCATQQNLRRDRFLNIDPHFNSRQEFADVIKAFDDVLESAQKEEDLQKFLSENPILIEPSYKPIFPRWNSVRP